jgi:transcription termination factor Rho
MIRTQPKHAADIFNNQMTTEEQTATPAEESISSTRNIETNSTSGETTQPAPSRENLPPVSIQDDLHSLTHMELIERAESIGSRIRPDATRYHLSMDQVRFHLDRGQVVRATGVLEISQNQSQIRWAEANFKPCVDDLGISRELIQKYGLQSGLKLAVQVRHPQGNRERGLQVGVIETIEGIPAGEWERPKPFDKLTPIYPKQRLVLETKNRVDITARAIDLVAPLGMGQRGIIAAPPRAGKTMVLKSVARAITKNHPDVHLILLLVDERPEEVTDMRREIRADIFSSTFDEPVSRHVQICELVSERAQRLVEHRQHVVILIDSLTRMARGYNNLQPNKGRTMSGGVDSRALVKPRKFFGSARNTEEGGSLTILATALIETQSRMDDLIFEEFKGTGNMELHLDRNIAEQRIFPAINIVKSGTRREDLLYHPDEFHRIVTLRRQLGELPSIEAMEVLAKNLRATDTNAEMLLAGLRGV